MEKSLDFIKYSIIKTTMKSGVCTNAAPPFLILSEGVSLMLNEIDSYHSLKKWKDIHILAEIHDTTALNQFHDEVMKAAWKIAITQFEKSFGTPPCSFSWFITGSGGRKEQGLYSDQDHGIVFYDDTKEAKNYFQKLGNEISKGLEQLGYPYCDGKIMSSNPMWCKSVEGWKEQLTQWMLDKSWESIRYLQIFYDSRTLIGNQMLPIELKKMIFHYHEHDNQLLQRFLDNIQFFKHAVGPLGQLFVQSSGKYEGCIDLKRTAFLPYVNAIRLLAIKEGIVETSTISRIDELSKKEDYRLLLAEVKENFKKLLSYRLSMFSSAESYEDVHYLSVKTLTKYEKREIKTILKGGKKVHQLAQAIIEKGVYHDF